MSTSSRIWANVSHPPVAVLAAGVVQMAHISKWPTFVRSTRSWHCLTWTIRKMPAASNRQIPIYTIHLPIQSQFVIRSHDLGSASESDIPWRTKCSRMWLLWKPPYPRINRCNPITLKVICSRRTAFISGRPWSTSKLKINNRFMTKQGNL